MKDCDGSYEWFKATSNDAMENKRVLERSAMPISAILKHTCYDDISDQDLLEYSLVHK